MDCAGDGSTITVTNFDPALNYVWSNGATGVSTFTYLAGTYTVVATDPVSGCSGKRLGRHSPATGHLQCTDRLL